MSASRPVTSGSSGQRGVHATGQADGFAGEVGAGQFRLRCCCVALVEDQVEHMQHGSQALAPRLSGAGSANGCGDALTFALARLIRWAIVASGTRNAAAISRVVSPPTARKVRGIAEAGVSAGVATHEHQDRACRRWPEAVGERRSTTTRRDPHGGGARRRCGTGRPCAGTPPGRASPSGCRAALGGPRGRGGDERLLHRVLGVGEVAVPPDDRAEDLRRRARAAGPRCRRSCGHISGRGRSCTWRTSMGWRIGTPFGPGAADAWAAISIARSIDSTSTSR